MYVEQDEVLTAPWDICMHLVHDEALRAIFVLVCVAHDKKLRAPWI